MQPSANKQYTKVEVEQIIFEWIIRDYSEKTLLESEFFSGHTGDIVWSMRLKKTRGWLSVTVQRVDSKLQHIAGSISVSLRNHQTDELSHMQAVQFYPNDVGYAESCNSDDSDESVLFEYDFSNIIRDHLLCNDAELLKNDQLIIVCEVFAKTQPILNAPQKCIESFSKNHDSNHNSIEADHISRNEGDVIDRSNLSPDSGIYDAKDRKKRVSFNLSQFADDLTSQYNQLTNNAQDAHEDNGHGFGDDDEYLADTAHDNYEESEGDDDVFINEDEGQETSTFEELITETRSSLSPRQPLVIEASDEFVHCKLISSEGEVDAYKSVSPLGADQEIISAMFTKRSDADNGRRAKVDVMEQAVMIELSRFTLSGNVQNLEQLADRLFVAADKYGIDELKELCENAMCKGISDDNVCARLILADQHPIALALLKVAALEHIKKNLNHVDKLNGYSVLLAEHPSLVTEIFLSLSKDQ